VSAQIHTGAEAPLNKQDLAQVCKVCKIPKEKPKQKIDSQSFFFYKDHKEL